MTNAQFIFNALTKQDMLNVITFMKDNKTVSLNDAVNWLYGVTVIDGEDEVFERDHDVSYKYHIRQYRIDTCMYYQLPLDNEDDEVIPF